MVHIFPPMFFFPQVIVYTYTGATPSVTLRRLSGVVLGKVAGSILQLALAVKFLGWWRWWDTVVYPQFANEAMAFF